MFPSIVVWCVLLGAEETGAEPHYAPEEAGSRAEHHRGEVRDQEEEVLGEQRWVPGGAQETLRQGKCWKKFRGWLIDRRLKFGNDY